MRSRFGIDNAQSLFCENVLAAFYEEILTVIKIIAVGRINMKKSGITVRITALFLILLMLAVGSTGCRKKKNKNASPETTESSQKVSEQSSNEKFKIKDNFGYVDKGGYAEIAYYAGDLEATVINVPSVIDGLPVKELREYLFADCENAVSINIPEGITSIGKYAFVSCKMLEEISIPKGINELNEGVFKYCSSLKKETLNVIDEYAFAGCSSLEDINIPDSMVQIADHAFSGCINLKNANIPIDIIDEVSYGITGTFPECREWTNDILMTDDDNDGIYSAVLTDLKKGTYEFKIRANGEWTESWGDLENGDTYNSQINCSIELTEKSDVQIYFDTTGNKREVWRIYWTVLNKN